MTDQGALLAALTVAGVEPLSLRVSDGEGRWTVAIESVSVPARGRVTAYRQMVARCGCGWATEGLILRNFGASKPDRIFEHVRGHVLAAYAAGFEIEQALSSGWAYVRITGGRVCCAAACHSIKGVKDPRATWGERCVEHDGTFDRAYHWLENDPELMEKSYETCLRAPDGRFWHIWCAPEGPREEWLGPDEDESEVDVLAAVTS